MNESNFAHAGLALACQILTALIAMAFGADVFEAAVMGGLLSVGFYWGREVTQAEAKAGGTPWWVGFDFRQWTQDSIYDLAMPVGACLLLLGLAWVFC